MIEPGLAEMMIAQIGERFRAAAAQGSKPALVCAAPIRSPLRRLLRLALPDLPIVSYPELSVASVAVNALGMIDDVRDLVS